MFLRFQEERDTADLQLEHRLAFGKLHDVLWGMGYRFSTDDLQALIAQMDEPARLEADKKVGLSRRIERLSRKVEDPVAIRQQIDEHLTAIARHQRRVAELQAKLDAISTSTGADLFS